MNTPNRSSLSKQEWAHDLLSGVVDPQSYFCRVLYYHRSHSQLYVKAESPTSTTNQPLILAFESVQYFAGPMMWQGLDFRLGLVDERINLLKGGWLDVGDWLEKFADDHLLFVLERPKYSVQIFSGTFYIGTTEPKIHQVFPDAPQEGQT